MSTAMAAVALPPMAHAELCAWQPCNRKNRIMWLKAVSAAAVLVAWMFIPSTAANAAGQCTDKTNPQAHQVCIANANGQCGGIGMFGASHSTCTYPDGSRDECDWHITSLTTATGSCTWFPTPPDFPIGPPPPAP